MNGIKFWRLKRRMSYAELARRSNCSYDAISHLEKGIGDSTSYLFLLRLADALGVTLDDLLDEYPEDALSPGDHPAARYTAQMALNPVGRYCREHNISLPQYAQMAGVRSRQAARRVWTKQKLKPSNVRPLAELEGLTVEEFLCRYEEEN